MHQGKRTRRVIAASLLAVMLSNTLAPTVAFALTSGPSAPEATSFEPVDTTDMVNLQTGDFTYNIPLLEVPGPEGGYPLALSYHAGIQPNEDASWVGLGWTLNPGAINRSVNGYPDDWYNPTNSSHEYWSGGTRTTYSVGISVGFANTPANASFGLSFSQDTYLGFGVGMSLGFGLSGALGKTLGISGGLTVGVSPYMEQTYASAGIGIQAGPLNAGASFSTNFESVNAGASLGIADVLDATISTGSNKPSLSLGGFSAFVSGTKAARIQTKTSGFNIDIPFAPGVNASLGYSKTRYWMDEKTTTLTHGSLYSSGWSIIDDRAYDTYSLLESSVDKNFIDYPDPKAVQGGSYMDFDAYSVNAQGLGGNIRPYLFQGEILGQNKKDENNNPLITYYSPGVTHATPRFRFVDDFSNSFRQNYPNYPDPNQNLRAEPLPLDASPVYGNGDGNYGYDGANALAGSRFVQVGIRLKPSNAKGYQIAERCKPNMINGFTITSESGVTYHYALPAFSWGEENYQERISKTNGLYFNRGTKGEAYAYTWYLTSVTGPDFVDRDNDSIAGPADWGNWVNFEYGKWSNKYAWRNPSEGFHRDEDNEWQNVSMGYKEIYYLNAIRTRSHIALFEKELRKDGKAASTGIFNKNEKRHPITNALIGYLDYTNTGIFDGNSSQSLRLNKIYLLNIADANTVTPTSGDPNAYRPTRSPACNDCELAANVLDKTDVDAIGRSNLEAKAVRAMDFTYDYSLCKSTTNSYDIPGHTVKYGKLTLKQVVLRGKGGASVFPPTKFEYDYGVNDGKTGTAFHAGAGGITTTTDLEEGELITFIYNNAEYYALVHRKSGTNYSLKWLNGGLPASVNINFKTTKNPPYNKDFYDEWGYYKSDFNTGLTFGYTAQDPGNENLGRTTGKIAAKATDAWSLRKIISPLGSDIRVQYESDTYRKSVLNQNSSIIASFARYPGGTYASDEYHLFMGDFAAAGYLPSYFFSQGDKINLVAFQEAHRNGWQSGAEHPYQRVVDSRDFTDPITVLEVNDVPNYGIKVKISAAFSTYLFTNRTGFFDASNVALSLTDPNINLYYPTSVNVLIENNRQVFGGGTRVQRLEIKNNSNNTVRSTIYNYSLPSAQTISSGNVVYEPTVFDPTNFAGSPVIYPGGNFVVFPHTRKAYQKALYNKVYKLFSLARELPSPAVMYEYVTVSNEVKQPSETTARNVEGKLEYQFEVFKENLTDRETINTQQSTSGFNQVRNIAIKKFTGSIGSVKRIIQYDDNGKKLTETINHYLHDGLESLSFTNFMSQYKSRLSQFSYQGYLQERMAEVKELNNQTPSTDNGVKATLSAREEYPSIAIGQTVINYVNGTRASSTNLAFDFYSGALVKSVETDAYGNRLMTEAIPAYRQYTAMGLRSSTNPNYKNMLTQVTGTYKYKVDASNNKLGLVSAQVETWSNAVPAFDKDGNVFTQNNTTNGDVWRKQAAYSWLPNVKTTDGLTAYANFTEFNWTTPGSSHANWKKTSETTIFDVYSKTLEVKDINGSALATRMSYGSKKVELSGGPANYYEIAYSGAEDAAVDQSNNMFVKKVDGVVSSVAGAAHTGTSSLKLGVAGKKGLVYTVNTNNLVAGRSYIASVWVKPVTGSVSDVKLYYTINGGTAVNSISSGSSTKVAGQWRLLNFIIPGSTITAGQTLAVGCRNDHATVEAYVDDMRFQPLNASTTAYVYDKFTGELTHVIDNSNLYTRYEYDAGGRLTKTYREKLQVGEFKTAETQYHFASCAFFSVEKSGSFNRQCPGGLAGSAVTYIVPAGQYCSNISQADADQMAQNDVNANGQNYANANGSCQVYARLTITNPGNISDVIVSFWSDAAGTIPASVTNMTVNLTEEVYNDLQGTSTYNNYPYSCNGTDQTLIYGAPYSGPGPGGAVLYYTYYLAEGAGYVIIN